MSPTLQAAPARAARMFLHVAGLLGLVVLGCAAARAEAPSPEQVTRGLAVWKKSDCANCHGWAGHGRETEPVPPAPSLRQTSLDQAQIREVAQCGRPSTTMPSHDRLAYTDERCYGMNREAVGKLKPPQGNPLQPADLDDVAAYVAVAIKGKGTVTKGECEAYHGPGAATCKYYPD